MGPRIQLFAKLGVRYATGGTGLCEGHGFLQYAHGARSSLYEQRVRLWVFPSSQERSLSLPTAYVSYGVFVQSLHRKGQPACYSVAILRGLAASVQSTQLDTTTPTLPTRLRYTYELLVMSPYSRGILFQWYCGLLVKGAVRGHRRHKGPCPSKVQSGPIGSGHSVGS